MIPRFWIYSILPAWCHQAHGCPLARTATFPCAPTTLPQCRRASGTGRMRPISEWGWVDICCYTLQLGGRDEACCYTWQLNKFQALDERIWVGVLKHVVIHGNWTSFRHWTKESKWGCWSMLLHMPTAVEECWRMLLYMATDQVIRTGRNNLISFWSLLRGNWTKEW